jgi:hypothetical protein
MTRKFRALGLTIAVVMAALAVSASAAQAGEFTAEKYPATLTGTQLSKHQFGFFNYSVSCTKASFDATLEAAAEAITVGASYSECTSGAGGAVTVKMTGCDYLFKAGETLGKDEVDGTMDVKCPVGAAIDFEDAETGCAIKIIPQEQLSTLVYTNHKLAKDFDVDIEAGNIKYNQNNLCPGGENMFFNGVYTGKSTITGDAKGGETAVTVD